MFFILFFVSLGRFLPLWSESKQTKRCQKLQCYTLKDSKPALIIQHRMAQRQGQQLIWSERAIISYGSIDDIIEIVTAGVPEALLKMFFTVCGLLLIERGRLVAVTAILLLSQRPLMHE